MVNDDQAARLLRLKALLDSGAITQEEFEKAKKAVLAESFVSADQEISKLKTKNLRLFGILGILSLAIPWSFSTDWQWGSISWQLFGYSWYQGYSNFYPAFMYLDLFNVLDVIGFAVVLVGSLLLFVRKRVGGILLLAATFLWSITYAISFLSGSSFITIPVGALLSGVVGIVSIIYRK